MTVISVAGFCESVNLEVLVAVVVILDNKVSLVIVVSTVWVDVTIVELTVLLDVVICSVVTLRMSFRFI